MRSRLLAPSGLTVRRTRSSTVCAILLTHSSARARSRRHLPPPLASALVLLPLPAPRAALARLLRLRVEPAVVRARARRRAHALPAGAAVRALRDRGGEAAERGAQPLRQGRLEDGGPRARLLRAARLAGGVAALGLLSRPRFSAAPSSSSAPTARGSCTRGTTPCAPRSTGSSC